MQTAIDSSRTVTVINLFTVVWAAVVVWAHMQSQAESEGASIASSSCDLRVNAWLATKYPCSIVQINCYRLGTAGSSDTLALVLSQFEREAMTRLVFSNCQALHVPSIITEFSRLREFEIFNSTISQWDESAAITRFKMPSVVHVLLIETNLTTSTGGLPNGILHDQMPRDMNLVVHRSNLTELPNNIGELWGHGNVRWITFWIENTALQVLPPSFSTLHFTKLSLVGNRLTQLPEDLFDKRMTMVRVSNNPLTALPASMADSSRLVQMLAEDTLISTVPEWLRSWWATKATRPRLVLSLHGSPVCCPSMTLSTSPAPWTCASTTEDECHPLDQGRREDFRYDFIAAQRPL